MSLKKFRLLSSENDDGAKKEQNVNIKIDANRPPPVHFSKVQQEKPQVAYEQVPQNDTLNGNFIMHSNN